MSLTFFLKDNLNKIPAGIKVGSLVSKIPYSYRPGIGSGYSKSKSEIYEFESNLSVRHQFIFEHVKKMVDHAYYNTKFYKNYYDDCGFDIKSLKSFSDINRIPLVSKDILNSYDINDISFEEKGRKLSNTGGSSGKPFHFYTSPLAIGHEWAHLHYMWSKLGFKPDMLKLNFYGRSSVKDHVDYDLIRHSLVVDIYSDFNDISCKLLTFAKKNTVTFLHGYPSSLYEFACYCENNHQLRNLLSSTLKGAFLSSEFPHQLYRDKIESVFGIDTQSFYGHTERCIMAYETSKFCYKVLQSYGYAEVINDCLIGTSYNSYATPLIRYNTEDKVSSFVVNNDILDSFVMKDGRSGEFILDRDNKMIPLTGLVFGRHHDIFNFVTNIQVYQKVPGEAFILYCPKNKLDPNQAGLLFDQENIKIKFSFIPLDSPIKTVSGKVQLKVNDFEHEKIKACI